MFDSFAELFWDLWLKMWDALSSAFGDLMSSMLDGVVSLIPLPVLDALSPMRGLGDFFAGVWRMVGGNDISTIIVGTFIVLIVVRIIRWALTCIPAVNAGG